MKSKNVIGFLLAIVLMVSTLSGVPLTASAAVWSGKAASSFAGGNGSKNSPYIIKNGEQLARMRNFVNSTNSKYYSYRKAYYKLGADIVLNSNSSNYASWGKSAPARKWTPIGSNNAFSGNFNGNGYTVSGLYVNSSSNYVGLFGYFYGTVSNLKIKNSYIIGTKYYTGAVAGYCFGYSDQKASVSNCSVSSTIVSGDKCVGGVVGAVSSYSSVYKCSNSARVIGGTDVGGVTGRMNMKGASYYSNSNSGTISGNDYVGGISGSISSASDWSGTVSSLSNKGSVTAAYSGAGGLFGSFTSYSSFALTKSYSNASVNGKYNAGGLVGYVTNSGKSLSVTQCNTGDSASVSATLQNAGGLFGTLRTNSNATLVVKNCNSGYGSVKAEDYAGGISAYINAYVGSNVVVSNNIAKSNLSVTGRNSGGIIGEIYSVSSKITITKNATVKAPSGSNSGFVIGYLGMYKNDNQPMPSVSISNNYKTYNSFDLIGYSASNNVANPVVSNNTYIPVPNLYNQSFCNSKLNIYACAWSFSSNAVPTVSVSAGHKYKSTTKKATMKADGSVTNVCTYCNAKSVSKINKIKTVKLSTTKYKYNKKVRTPGVTVKDSAGKTLKKNTDYTVSYPKGRKKVGTYKVKVTFKGKYSGSKTLTFKIVKK